MVVESNLHGGIGLVRGDKFSLRRIVDAVPATTLISKAWLTVKTATSDVDGSAIFQKEITTTNVAGTGEVEEEGTDGIGVLRFDLTTTNTLAMTADVSYYYDIQILLNSGDIFTLESGRTSAREQVTIDNT